MRKVNVSQICTQERATREQESVLTDSLNCEKELPCKRAMLAADDYERWSL